MFGWLFRKRERDIQDELDYHLAMLAAETEEGPGNDARLGALRRLGNRTSIQEEIRRASPWAIFESGGRNAIYALRTMRRNPAFSVTAILTMALGICSAVLIFGILDAVVLRPLPYRDSNGIVFLWEHKRQLNGERMTVAPANYRSWRESSRAFADMALVEGARFHWSKNGETRTVRGLSVSRGFFGLLGAAPRIGHIPSSIHEVVLSDSFWRQQFNGNAGVIGKPVALSDKTYSVVGVMPPEFYFPDFGEKWEVWTQLELSPGEASDRDAHCCGAIGRLRPGVTIAQAQRDMNHVSARLEHEFPETNRGAGVTLVPAREQA
ncbi:MAG: ABC transporter permease, partial [Bryobacteraceae bacterium]